MTKFALFFGFALLLVLSFAGVSPTSPIFVEIILFLSIGVYFAQWRVKYLQVQEITI